jgi:hypothetical protein
MKAHFAAHRSLGLMQIGIMAWLLWCGSSALAAPRLVAGTVRGFPGQSVEVPILLRYGTNDPRDVVAFQADVVFDPSGLSDGYPRTGSVVSNHVFLSSSPIAGTRRLLAYSAAGAALTNGEVARIPFAVAPSAARNFPILLTNVILVRADATTVAATTVNGAIAVNQVYLAPDGHADGFLNVVSNGVEQCYIIQATTDFQTWVNVQTNSTDGTLLQFIDPSAKNYPHRFYRAIVCESVPGTGTTSPIGMITQLPGSRVQFEFTRTSGPGYLIQASTNLSQWENIRTNVGVSGPITFIDSFTNYPQRFYRLRAVE